MSVYIPNQKVTSHFEVTLQKDSGNTSEHGAGLWHHYNCTTNAEIINHNCTMHGCM